MSCPSNNLRQLWTGVKFEGPPNLKSCERRKDPGTTALLLHTHPLRRHAQHMLWCGGSDGKESAHYAGRQGFDPWVAEIPWRREWQPTPVFLPGEFRGQRNLEGYSPWGCKESDDWVTNTSLQHMYNWLLTSQLRLLRKVKSWLLGITCELVLGFFGGEGSLMNLLQYLVQFSSVAQSCPTLCRPTNHSMPGLPVHHKLLESIQTHVHRIGDGIQPSHTLSSPPPPTHNPS